MPIAKWIGFKLSHNISASPPSSLYTLVAAVLLQQVVPESRSQKGSVFKLSLNVSASLPSSLLSLYANASSYTLSVVARTPLLPAHRKAALIYDAIGVWLMHSELR